MEEQRLTLPFIPLKGICIMPGTSINFDVGRAESIKAVDMAMANGQMIFLVAQRQEDIEKPGPDDIFQIGTVAKIRTVTKLPNNVTRVSVNGLYRGCVQTCDAAGDYIKGEILPYEPVNSGEALSDEEKEAKKIREEAMLRELKELFSSYAARVKVIPKNVERILNGINKLNDYIVQICMHIQVGFEKKQEVMECLHFEEQYECLSEILQSETKVLQIKNELSEKVKNNIDKTQKEYVLREQQKMIREELGEGDRPEEAHEFLEQAEAIEASDEVKDHLKKEIKRFQNSSPYSAETGVLRTYIETLLAMPWGKASVDNLNIKHAAKVLDEDHYGLEKVKERVLEFLAVRALTKRGDSPIICLVGPPGTGKTSIAKSVARALEKKFIRVSLGGVRDEAEIRGHRKTYVGAMPGRIAVGMKNAGVNNPLILLDEIDKTGKDQRGDTASALLEVLDSEQNVRFVDHYLEVPIDLSQVLFIATANSIQTIPRPLLDRMEIIEVSSYTSNEKFHIAEEYLIPKQLKANGLTAKKLTISDEVVMDIILHYTREAGVRNLERFIGQLCRKTARKILETKVKHVEINVSDVEEYLGKRKYRDDELPKTDEPGIVRGLAWTSVGGETLEIEVNVMPGKGELMLTGQMGDVMKESARAGISYIRSVADEYDIEPKFFQSNDIHIHIPEGAVPKDGPSAGISMTTAMLSAITKKPVKHTVAMTGEVTLRGRVLPVGGLKEKILAAKNIGITTVILPAKNRPNVEEIETEITEGLKIVYVDKMDEVLKEAFA